MIDPKEFQNSTEFFEISHGSYQPFNFSPEGNMPMQATHMLDINVVSGGFNSLRANINVNNLTHLQRSMDDRKFEVRKLFSITGLAVVCRCSWDC